MKDPTRYLRMLNFKWLPKHIQHITEHIVFDKRNVSFLAINALFRQYKTHKVKPSEFGNDHFMVKDFVPLQKNDRTRILAEELTAIFYIDQHGNIVVITAFSENDEYA